MSSPAGETPDGAAAAARALTSFALLAAVTVGTLVVLSLFLVALVAPFVLPLVLLAAAMVARLEEARLARFDVTSS